MKLRAAPRLLREEEAHAFVDRIENPIIRKLVKLPYRETLRRFAASKRLSVEDLDLKFFVEGLFISFGDLGSFKAYVDGEDHRWFPEDDEQRKNATFCPLPEPPKPAQGSLGISAYSTRSTLGSHEANWLTCSLDDVALKQIVYAALFAFERHAHGLEHFPGEPHLPQRCPRAPVDLLFCAGVLIASMSDMEMLRAILAPLYPNAEKR